eukprot:gnl/MRDRNA2_/MRDRNA2_30066_c0_seq1.p1 gnl/MRDRNA2_/MRDRNA2_30066_c0~~gnl/MRDRNA2_/MRDRNA2_30066_c0_seq1.p1  ORF type:complete len:280 (+),score=46.69 gnl/MRDRNA2_/MRDRNA2_30066_c0_seq1:87-926(+)
MVKSNELDQPLIHEPQVLAMRYTRKVIGIMVVLLTLSFALIGGATGCLTDSEWPFAIEKPMMLFKLGKVRPKAALNDTQISVTDIFRVEGMKSDGGAGPRPPQEGIVSRWIPEKGFGFIQPSVGGDQLFCHKSALLDGEASVNTGDKVQYIPSWNARQGKNEASEVQFLSKGEAPQEVTGKMARWIPGRGFGFIKPSDGGEEIFCHISALLGGEGSVIEGDDVQFKLMYDSAQGKYKCSDVRLASKDEIGTLPPESADGSPTMLPTELPPTSVEGGGNK